MPPTYNLKYLGPDYSDLRMKYFRRPDELLSLNEKAAITDFHLPIMEFGLILNL